VDIPTINKCFVEPIANFSGDLSSGNEKYMDK
jgi:hypothetical protein